MNNAKVENFHASCVCINGSGVLIIGPSGAGKSDLTLRLIENKKAVLVADDQVYLSVENGKLYAAVPETIAGLLEVRGVGIVKMPYMAKTAIKLVVKLCAAPNCIERLPGENFFAFQELKIEQLDLYPFEVSATDKIVIKLKALLD